MSLLAHYLKLVDWIVTFAPSESDKIVHTYVGLAIWLITALALRRPLGSRVPIMAVVLAELLNEIFDYAGRTLWTWADTQGDVIATLFWPLVLFVVIRWIPAMTRSKAQSAP
jgi:hypothetical protein